MSAPYDARQIANLLLESFDSNTNGVTNKKINKILYYIHAVALVRLEIPLIKNHFEAWDHGPVVRVVYHSFKNYEYRPISALATCLDYVSGQEVIMGFDHIRPEHKEFILKVAGYFMKFTADELEDMTHRADGPWAKVRALPEIERGIRNRIPDELILEHFKNRYGRQEPVN
jgi:uncharacterized phage-associated protein